MSHRQALHTTSRAARSRRAAALVLAGLVVSMGMLGAQDPPAAPLDPTGRVIERVEFEGIRTVDVIYLRGVAEIRPGDIWNRDAIAAACRRLAETQKFEGEPFAEPREEDGKLVLVFVVKERPFITAIDFAGNEKFDDGKLMEEIDLEVGSPVSEFLITQARMQIEDKYREAGYSNMSVEVDAALLESEQRVLFRISEGPRIRVDEIEFSGNAAFGNVRLRSMLETQTHVWLFRTGAFDEEAARRDAATLKAFYVARGYLNAQVGYRVDFGEDEGDLILTFLIEEGLQHVIKTITVEGNEVIGTDRLRSLMTLTEGSVLDADVLKADRQKLVDEYGSNGYIYNEVTTSHVFDEEDGYVHLKVSIVEGDQYRFGRIVVRGNRNTKDRVIRRELRFFPEKLYDTAAAKKAEQRLTETRLFNDVRITPQGEAPGVRDALVSVEEADTTTILFGVGVTSNSGLVGSISLEQRNFDIFDTPRTAGEFFRGRSFRGAGQTMRLQIEPGTELTRGRLEFREPYLFDREVGMALALYLFERDRDEFEERRIGFTPSLDKRFREGLLAGWAGEVALRFEHINIDDVDWWRAKEIREDEGDSWLTSIKLSMLRDRTDSLWLPSTGDRLRVSWEQAGVMGGDHVFAKVTGSYDKYYTLKTDTFGRKHILALGASTGQILGDAPVFEKFYGGGIGSIRGFDFRGVSPRAGIEDDRVGGDFMLLTNAEYSFPLVGSTVRGATFLDMGTVEEDFGIHSWRAAVGFGMRIHIKYFGPIPLAFDFAWPMAKDDEDDTQVFSFSFGTTF